MGSVVVHGRTRDDRRSGVWTLNKKLDSPSQGMTLLWFSRSMQHTTTCVSSGGVANETATQDLLLREPEGADVDFSIRERRVIYTPGLWDIRRVFRSANGHSNKESTDALI
jgi:hypothetical protein